MGMAACHEMQPGPPLEHGEGQPCLSLDLPELRRADSLDPRSAAYTYAGRLEPMDSSPSYVRPRCDNGNAAKSCIETDDALHGPRQPSRQQRGGGVPTPQRCSEMQC